MTTFLSPRPLLCPAHIRPPPQALAAQLDGSRLLGRIIRVDVHVGGERRGPAVQPYEE